jgi:hypothetical protein
MTLENPKVVVSNCLEHKRTDDIPIGKTIYGTCFPNEDGEKIHSPLVRKDPKSKKLICYAFSCPFRTNPES